MFCVYCGAKNADGVQSCAKCGSAMVNVATAEASPASTAATPAGVAPSQATAQQPSSGVIAGNPDSTRPATGAWSARPSTAPPTLGQVVAAVNYTKNHERGAIALGILVLLFLFFTTHSVLLAAVGGVVVYLVSFGFLLPFIWRPTIACPVCGKPVQALSSTLPKLMWPRSCPHCLSEIKP